VAGHRTSLPLTLKDTKWNMLERKRRLDRGHRDTVRSAESGERSRSTESNARKEGNRDCVITAGDGVRIFCRLINVVQ